MNIVNRERQMLTTGNLRQYFRVCILAAVPVFSQALFAQSGPIPAYISSTPAFNATRLDGANAPANGNISMADITPGEWLNNDPGTTDLRSVIVSWNGGAKGIGSKLFVHGGGHTNSANNGLYIYDFGGGEKPLGWIAPLLISPVSAVVKNTATYSDGMPTAVHTYDGLVYADHNQHVYRFAGSQYNVGFMKPFSFKWSQTSNRWTRLPDYPSAAGGAKTIYDAGSGKIFVTMNSTSVGHFFRTTTDTWSKAVSYTGRGFPFNSMGALDPTRSRGIIVGDGTARLLTIDFSGETVTTSDLEPSGDTEIIDQGGISAVYDSTMDVYWMFGGGEGSPGWSKIYQMNASGPPWNIRAYSLTGDTIERSSGMHGSWGRYVFMPAWRALGLVAHHNGPAFVVRLPGESVPAPEAPSNMNAEQTEVNAKQTR